MIHTEKIMFTGYIRWMMFTGYTCCKTQTFKIPLKNAGVKYEAELILYELTEIKK